MNEEALGHWEGGGRGGAVEPEEREKSVECKLTKLSSLRRVQSTERLKRIR